MAYESLESGLPSKLAKRSMVLGLISLIPVCVTLFIGIAAVLLSLKTLKNFRALPKEERGRGFAIAGLITGLTSIGFNIFVVCSMLYAAKELAVQGKCKRNLMQVGLGLRIWSGDHNDTFPKSFLELTNEIKDPSVFICPDDTKRLKLFQRNTNQWNTNLFTYEYLLPGVSEDQISNRIVVRCPIHGAFVDGDGTVPSVERRT